MLSFSEVCVFESFFRHQINKLYITRYKVMRKIKKKWRRSSLAADRQTICKMITGRKYEIDSLLILNWWAVQPSHMAKYFLILIVD